MQIPRVIARVHSHPPPDRPPRSVWLNSLGWFPGSRTVLPDLSDPFPGTRAPTFRTYGGLLPSGLPSLFSSATVAGAAPGL